MAASAPFSSEPSTETLLSWAKHISWLKGHRRPVPSFDPMLFCGELDWDRDAPLDPVPTVKTELDNFASDDQLWQSREMYLIHPKYKHLQEKLHVEVSKRLAAAGATNKGILDSTEVDIFRKVAALETSEEKKIGPGDDGASAASIAAAFGYNTTSNAVGPGPLIKLVLGTRYPDDTGIARIVELQLFPDDDWNDARQIFEREAKAHWTALEGDWYYCIEAKKGGKTDGKKFSLKSRQDWEGLTQALKGKHRGKAALVFQETWKDAVSSGQVKLEKPSTTEEAPWYTDVVDGDGKPVFQELTLDFLMSSSFNQQKKKSSSTKKAVRKVKLPLQMSESWRAEKRAQGDSESLAALETAEVLDETHHPVAKEFMTPGSTVVNLLDTSETGMRLRSGKRKAAGSPTPQRSPLAMRTKRKR